MKPFRFSENVTYIIVFLLLLIIIVIPPILQPEMYITDDSYFYLQVAHNIMDGYGSTFSRITDTNGYHPAWMEFCVLSAALSENDKELTLVLINSISILLFLGILYFFIKCSKQLDNRYLYLGLPVLTVYFATMGMFASEAFLNGFLVMLSISVMLRAMKSERSVYLILAGFLLGLAILARLDNIFFAGISILFLMYYRYRIHLVFRVKDIILISLPVFLLVAPYLLYNYLNFSNIIPISGKIKSTFPLISFSLRIGPFGFIGLVFSALGLWLSFFEKNLYRKFILHALGCSYVLLLVYLVLFTRGAVGWSWYYVTGLINASFISGYLFEYLSAGFKNRFISTSLKRAAFIFALAIMVFCGYKNWHKISGHYDYQITWWQEISYWMRDNLPPETRIYTYDFPGMTAYFSDQRILPMDGLINNFQYNYDLRDLGVAGYLQRNGVGHYFGPILKDGESRRVGAEDIAFCSREGEVQIIETTIPLFGTSAGFFRTDDENLLVTFNEIIEHPIIIEGEEFRLGIWKLKF